ncbi:MAG TPA: family 16 glycoside hydrolase [Roseiflexaceae bacterium]|nr:family 16 glycoside hydrolase [Roseiflexaceae bacterium]
MKRLFTLGLLLASALTALWPAFASAAEPPKPVGKLVYEDDFNDSGKKSGLEENKGASDYSRGFHAPGVYHLKDIKKGETHWSMFPHQSYGDFTIEIDLFDSSDDFTGDISQGLIVRAKDDAHFYTVLIDPRLGQYGVRKQDGANKWSDLVAFKASPLVKKEADVNHLRIDAIGDKFTVYLNGESLTSFSDAAYKQGGIGLIASNVDAVAPHMHFDNIKVYSNEAAPATGAQNAPAALPTTGADGAAPLALAAWAFALLLMGLWVRQRR